MENDITLLEDFIALLKDFVDGIIEKDQLEIYEGGYKLGTFYTKDLQCAISNLIERYNKLKEINEVLERQKFRLFDDNLKLLEDANGNNETLNYRYIDCPKVEGEYYKSDSYIKENYVSKSRVKEEIKELESRKDYKPLDNRYTYKEIIEFGIEELEELLKEEN